MFNALALLPSTARLIELKRCGHEAHSDDLFVMDWKIEFGMTVGTMLYLLVMS